MNNRAEVVSVGDQRGVLISISDVAGYKAYTEKHFSGDNWVKEVEAESVRRQTQGEPHDPNRYKHLTLTSLMAGQFGFDSLVGQLGRHRSYYWEKPVQGAEH